MYLLFLNVTNVSVRKRYLLISNMWLMSEYVNMIFLI